MGLKKREFAVFNKIDNQWFIAPTLLELSAVANKAMQFTTFPTETNVFWISEIQDGSFIGRDGEVVSAKDLSASNLVGGVIGHNILTGEIQEFESVLLASKYTGVSYGTIQHRACVHPVAPWPSKNWCFKWASSDAALRAFTQEEIDVFTDVENICVPVKFRHVDSASWRGVLTPTINAAAKEIGCSVSTAVNALRMGNARVGKYQLWYLK
jgi:hypothetical protein